MDYTGFIKDLFVKAVHDLYDIDIDIKTLILSPTKKEFEGDYTIVIFPFVNQIKKSPEVIGAEVGAFIVEASPLVKSSNVIKGFLNLELSDVYWVETLSSICRAPNYGEQAANGEKVLVEFSSPNTNKPLHLGHIRNILLGWSCSKILKANGYDVSNVQIINDRGIAICKSMLAWREFGEGQTPEQAGIKPDHFVGKWYVYFETQFNLEYKAWQSTEEALSLFKVNKKDDQVEETFFKAYKNEYFNRYSILGNSARTMLQDWEAGDAQTVSLWKKMNQWVYDGFADTYKELGVKFDKLYYESDTYLLGKKAVETGLQRGTFYQNDDSSVWIDLTDVGMDQKILLRSDGTSVYMTQDLGTAMMRFEDFGADKMIYTVADEQDYHFKVLFEILNRLGEPYASGLHHLSYGMVDLTTGKMKSREGTVVDADDLMSEVIDEARNATAERGEIMELSKEEQEDIITKIGIAALKFYIIKVNPKKRITFDPKESLDMQGQTGPYVQNAYVRIKSILRKNQAVTEAQMVTYDLNEAEKSLLKLVIEYPERIIEAGRAYDPSTIANYSYALAKEFHRFYHDVRILNAESPEAKAYRLALCGMVGQVLAHSMDLLGIAMPERM